MKNIRIDFKGVIPKTGQSYVFSLPETWSELTKNQAITIMPYFFGIEQNSISKSNILAAVLPYAILQHVTYSQVESLTPLLGWIFATPHIEKSFEGFVIGEELFLLPDNSFENVAFDEWLSGHINYIYYQITKEQKYLDLFIASYCRPKRTDLDPNNPTHVDDNRQPYSSVLMKNTAKKLANALDYKSKLYAISFLTANISAISNAKHFGRVFPKSLDEVTEGEKTESKAPKHEDAMNWWDWGLNWSQTLQMNFETEFCKMNIHNIFRLVQNYLKNSTQ